MNRNWLVEFRIKQKKEGTKWIPTRETILSLVQERILGKGFPPILADSLKCINKTTTGSKARGSDYERRVAKALGEWWWGKPFRRTPNSGGWDKQSTDGEVMAAGDLIAPPEANFPFCVECKHRKDPLNLYMQKTESSDGIFDWWDQCVRDARTAHKLPLLIMCCARVEYAAFTGLLFSQIQQGSFPFHFIQIKVFEEQYPLAPPSFHVMLFKQLLEGIPHGKKADQRIDP